MNETHQSLEEILFNLAVQKSTPAERAAFLSHACRENPTLRAAVEALLDSHFGAAGFLPPLASVPGLPEAPTVPAPAAETHAEMIGRYKLLEKIGEGGFGEVWMAEQREPVKRRVALKILKPGMDSRQVVARFEAERQALAMMDHPHIARIYDAGTTDSGRPYFVMELVRGTRITDYCDQHQLTTDQRLDLFIKVCQAIQHAHQKGIIHRDIKPSNVLVTVNDGAPVPKVIDFGIAKATQQELTDKTVFTQFQQFIGTPAYISPEQAEMSSLDIDTRADIYSLGVLLYELLIGQTPFDAREMMQGGFDALRKIIREREPQRPSTKLNTLIGEERTTAGKRRQTDVAKLAHQLQGDLDWIVLKCLEKDRTRRYDTANGLAMDIQRYLTSEPVTARPPSTGYRFQRMVRRNKLAFAAGGVVVIGLLIGLAAVSYALIRERALKSESARADSIATFVTGMLNKAVPQLVLQGNTKGMRVLLESAEQLVATTLTNTPTAELTVRDTLQMFYGNRLRDPQKARKQADRMASLLPLVPDDRLPPNRSRDDLRIDIAGARWWAGAAPQGRAELDQLAEEFRQRGPTADVARARTLRLLGYTLISMDKPLESEAPLSEAYRLEPSVGEIYCRALILNGKYPQAEKVARAAVSRVHADLAKPGTRKAFDEFKAGLGAVDSYAAFAEVLVRLGRFDEAETLLAEQLGPAAAVWSPAQLKTLKHLQLGVQACSGGWREAAPGVIALATNAVAELYDWTCGITAAVAIGDTNAHARLDRWGRARYIGNAEVETADLLVWSILLRPGQDDLSVTVPDLLSRIEEAKDYHWTAINLPLLRSQLAYRKGEYEDALRFLDAWVQSKDERPMNASFLHTFRSLPIAEFWRAMILAGLGRPEEAGKAYADGVQKTRAGIATHLLVFEPYYAMALQQEAREVFRSRGMAVPDR